MLAQDLTGARGRFYYKPVLVIDAQRVFRSGMGLLAAGVLADSAVHLAGWVAAEQTVHWTLLLGMVLSLGGVFLRALDPTLRRESAHADR